MNKSTRIYDGSMSFDTLHTINKRATPKQFTTYSHAILLHKWYNDETLNNNWLDLFFNQQFNGRSYKIGNNILSNRFTILNGKIKFDWLNLPFDSYELKCKNIFLWDSVLQAHQWLGDIKLSKYKGEVHPNPWESIKLLITAHDLVLLQLKKSCKGDLRLV